VKAFQTDLAGNVSTGSANLDITIDTTGLALAATSETFGPGSSGKLNLNGTGEAGSIVSVVEGATSLGSRTVAADGSWTFNVGKVSDVDHTFTLSEAADLAGNVSTSLAIGELIARLSRRQSSINFRPLDVLACDLSLDEHRRGERRPVTAVALGRVIQRGQRKA
jgi:hypothetical protein